MNDKVMVVTPTYCTEENGRLPLLLQSIYGVAKQTHKNIVHVVVDDGSTDGTPQVLEKIANENPHIKVFHKNNAGSSSAVNYGVDKMLSEEDFGYVTITHSDDILFPKSIEDRVNAANHDKFKMVYSDMVMFDDTKGVAWLNKATEFSDSDSLYNSLRDHVYIPYPTMLWQTSFFTDRLDGYDERITSAEDWDIALRSAQEINRLGERCSMVGKATVAYRLHKNNLGYANLRDGTKWKCYKMILGKHRDGVDYNFALAKEGVNMLRAFLPEPVKKPLRFVKNKLLTSSSPVPFVDNGFASFLKDVQDGSLHASTSLR